MSIGFAEGAVNEVSEQVSDAVADGRLDLRGFQHIGDSVLDAALGYLVVFIGLLLLMIVIIVVGKFFSKKKSVPADTVAAPAVSDTSAVTKKLAPGSAGDVKIYDTDPRDAAMIMAIVADKLGKPLNELRFRSIKEVK